LAEVESTPPGGDVDEMEKMQMTQTHAAELRDVLDDNEEEHGEAETKQRCPKQLRWLQRRRGHQC
jgi:hypothetical protein